MSHAPRSSSRGVRLSFTAVAYRLKRFKWYKAHHRPLLQSEVTICPYMIWKFTRESLWQSIRRFQLKFKTSNFELKSGTATVDGFEYGTCSVTLSHIHIYIFNFCLHKLILETKTPCLHKTWFPRRFKAAAQPTAQLDDGCSGLAHRKRLLNPFAAKTRRIRDQERQYVVLRQQFLCMFCTEILFSKC